MKRETERIPDSSASPGPPSPEPSASRRHLGWYKHGYLPHFDEAGLVQSVTFRLHDSLPLKVVVEWRRELGWTRDLRETDPRARELRRRVERYEDAGWGSCWLAREEIGALVESALFHFDGERYRLLAWCVMPNHVHVLIELVEGWPLGRLVSSWKSFTVKQANRLLGRSGAFWAGDYHDRFIRNAEHLAAVASYIEHNPAEAGLVERPQDWPFSSARARASPAGGTPADPGDRVERRRRFPES